MLSFFGLKNGNGFRAEYAFLVSIAKQNVRLYQKIILFYELIAENEISTRAMCVLLRMISVKDSLDLQQPR